MPRRREREKAQRGEAILAAAERVFARHGFHGATLEKIAQAAEFVPGTVYLYFKNKEALYAALFASRLAQLADEVALAAAGAMLFPGEAAPGGSEKVAEKKARPAAAAQASPSARNAKKADVEKAAGGVAAVATVAPRQAIATTKKSPLAAAQPESDAAPAPENAHPARALLGSAAKLVALIEDPAGALHRAIRAQFAFNARHPDFFEIHLRHRMDDLPSAPSEAASQPGRAKSACAAAAKSAPLAVAKTAPPDAAWRAIQKSATRHHGLLKALIAKGQRQKQLAPGNADWLAEAIQGLVLHLSRKSAPGVGGNAARETATRKKSAPPLPAAWVNQSAAATNATEDARPALAAQIAHTARQADFVFGLFLHGCQRG